jgi:hypothetical protein
MLGETHFVAGNVEHLRNLVGENPLAAHAGTETGIVEFAAADGADSIQYLFLFAEVGLNGAGQQL